MLAAAKGGKDPFKGKTGDLERHYLLQGANEIMPYRVYVPKGYTARGDAAGDCAARPRRERRLVLRQLLETAAAAGREARLPAGRAARLPRRRLLRLAIMGAGDAASRRRGEYSEKDVMEVLRLMKADYKVDESRIYLIGHSMGAIGTWALGAKYPDIWAALVPFSGVGAPTLAETHEGHPAVRRPRRCRQHRQRHRDRATWWRR